MAAGDPGDGAGGGRLRALRSGSGAAGAVRGYLCSGASPGGIIYVCMILFLFLPMPAKVTPISQGVAILRTLQASASDPLGSAHEGVEQTDPRSPGTFGGGSCGGRSRWRISTRRHVCRGKAALPVWLLIHHQHELRRQEEITLPRTLLADAGVSPYAKVRALRQLEAAGLDRGDLGSGAIAAHPAGDPEVRSQVRRFS